MFSTSTRSGNTGISRTCRAHCFRTFNAVCLMKASSDASSSAMEGPWNSKTSLSRSLYMHIIMSISESVSRILPASTDEFAQMKVGGLLRFNSLYSLTIWLSIRPSSSRVNAS